MTMTFASKPHVTMNTGVKSSSIHDMSIAIVNLAR